MGYKVGTVLIDIKADTAKLVTGMEKAEKAVNKLKESLSNLIKITAAVIIVDKIGDSLKGLSSTFIETTARFEQFNMALVSIEGSSKKAEQAMKWITDFASKTPYTLDQVTESFIKLRAYGLDATKDLKFLGDTAAAMGKPLSQVVEAIADAVNGEFERLKEFGIKGYQLGDKAALQWVDRSGKVRNIVIENNAKIIESTLKAIWNSKYAGAMQLQSKTWNGLLSTMQGNWEIFQNNVMKAGLFDWLKANLMTIMDYLQKAFGKGEQAAKNYSDTIIKMSKNAIIGVANFLDIAKYAKRAFDYFKVGINVIKLAFYSALDLSERISVKIHNIVAKIHNNMLTSFKHLPKFAQPDWVKNNEFEKIEIYRGKYLKDINESKNDLNKAIMETNAKLTDYGALAKKYLKDTEKNYTKITHTTTQTTTATTNYIKVLNTLGKVNNGTFKGFKNTNTALKEQKDLLKQLQNQYNNLYLTPMQQLDVWANNMLTKVLSIKDNVERIKGLKLLKDIYDKKSAQIEQNKLGFDDNTYKAYKDLSKKFGEDSAKSFASALSIFMKSSDLNDLFSNAGKALAKNGGTGGAIVGFFVEHLQETMTYIFDKVYDNIRSKYTDKIEAYNQQTRNETLKSQAYNAFGFEGKGAVASYRADLANTKALEETYKMDYALMKRAKINKEVTQHTMEIASIVAGAAAAVWFSGVAALKGLDMALDAKNWADKATGFSKFQQQFIEATEQYKEAIRKLADDLIKISGDIYKSIKDYRDIFDKITGSNTYKVQNYKESLSFISKYSDLTASSLADLTQNVLKASKDFVEGATKTAGDAKKLMQDNIFDKYGLAIDALNSKFKNSLGVIANLIDAQRKAKDAIADYVAELKGSLGDTKYNKRYTQEAFAQALKDYYAGKVDGSTLLEKAKAYQTAGGDVSKIIKTLQGVEAQSTKDYLKGILDATTKFSTIGLPDANIQALQSPEIETLAVIKDTKSILERIVDLLGNINFKNILDEILDSLKNIFETLKNILKAIGELALVIKDAAVAIVKGIVNAITEAFRGLGHIIGVAWDWTKNAINGVYKWGSYQIENVYAWSRYTISNVYSWSKKQISDVYSWGKDEFASVWNSIKKITDSLKNIGGNIISGGRDLIGSIGSGIGDVIGGIGHGISHLFAQGGYTGVGIGQKDSTGEIVAGIVHAGEWVAPKWMVNSMPNVFNALESLRVRHLMNNSLFTPVVNVAIDLELIRETNSILTQQLSIQKKMYRLMQKFDEEGIKCVS